MKYSKWLEKASGPGYIVFTGFVAYAEDVFIERPEGACRRSPGSNVKTYGEETN